MNKDYKYLFKNIGLLTISNFTSKILTFLLVPLYTNVLTTEEYGTYDFYVVTALLLVPLLSVDIVDSILRFSLDKSNSAKDVFSIGLRTELLAIVFCAFLIGLNYSLGLVEILNEYPIVFIIYYASLILSDMMMQFARGIDKVKETAIAGIINSVTNISLNIYFLVFIHLGLYGFFYATIMSMFASALYLFICIRAWKYINLRKINRQLKYDMISYSVPLILSNLSGWVNNLSSRYIIIWFCGAAVNGVFSAATKIPAILLVFQTIFSQAWTLSAVKTIDNKNKDFFKSVYCNYSFGLVIVCSLIIVFNKILSSVIFGPDFYEAWQYAPFLLISVVFSSLTGFFVGLYSALKRSKELAKTMTAGAVINLILCILLTRSFGAIGAAIAALFAYISIWLFQLLKLSSSIDFRSFLPKDALSYSILLVQAITMYIISNDFILYPIELFCLIVLMFINKSHVKKYVLKISSKL